MLKHYLNSLTMHAVQVLSEAIKVSAIIKAAGWLMVSSILPKQQLERGTSIHAMSAVH